MIDLGLRGRASPLIATGVVLALVCLGVVPGAHAGKPSSAQGTLTAVAPFTETELFDTVAIHPCVVLTMYPGHRNLDSGHIAARIVEINKAVRKGVRPRDIHV